uniref:Kelch domain containing 3 n=2 Tax=Sinocyclocheilus grahami TaxID=75366 RepID=A0A672P7G7_SINGR
MFSGGLARHVWAAAGVLCHDGLLCFSKYILACVSRDMIIYLHCRAGQTLIDETRAGRSGDGLAQRSAAAERGMLRWMVHLEGGPRRVNHAAVAVGHKVYSFGGYCSGEDYETLRQIDVHVFNTESLRWTKLPPVRTGGREHAREVPYMRYGHTAVLVEEAVLIWGGRNDTEGACNVLYAFDVTQHRWFTPKISGTVPGARDGHSACVLGKAMYIFGGYEQLADCFSNEIHKLDTSSMCWSIVSVRGTPARWRDFHSATIIGTKMFVFGGRADRFGPFHSNNEIYCKKIKIFDTETNCWLNTASAQLLPEGRRSHSAFAYNGELYIFGGYNARLDRHFNDLWKFNPEAFSWKKLEPKGKGPCPRRRQCCCMLGDRIVLFGGTSPCPEQGMGDEFNLMDHSDLYLLDYSPNLKTLCKLAVIQYSLEQSGLPHDIRWELTAMTTNSNISRPIFSSHG